MGTVTITDLQARQIREQRLKGCGYKAIASAVGLSRDLVRNYCRSNGLDGPADALATDEQAHQDRQMCIRDRFSRPGRLAEAA